MKYYIAATIFSFLLLFQNSVYSTSESEPVNASLITEIESIQPSTPFWVMTRLKLHDNWHLYWKNPGDAGMAPSITWKLPEGFSAEEIQFPYPQKFTSNDLVSFGYEDELLLLTKIIPAKNLTAKTVEFSAEISWVACSGETCLPGDATLSFKMAVKREVPDVKEQHTALFASAREKLPQEAPKISATQQANSITLVVPHKEGAVKATFFPETDQPIDIKGKIAVKPHAELQDHHVVVLPSTGEAKQLKGVLITEGKEGKSAFAIDLAVEKSPTVAPSIDFEGGLALALCFAFLGGMILNLMPCVLPVMSFKVLGFVKMAGQSRSLTLKHGIYFSIGVLVSFWALAALLLVLQSYGNAVGWGFQLQEPLFVASLATVLLVFGLSLFGVFELGTSIASKAGQAQVSTKNSELFGSFVSGVLATAVATPCTGPFLGTALGYAVTQPPLPSMMIFTFIGLGMAFPYLLLAAFPSLLRFMPKPGPWMETFKEMMGFLMLGTVLWLIWVFSAQTNYLAVTMLLGGFFAMAIGCWVYGKWATPLKKKGTRMVSTAITLLFFAAGAHIIYTSTTPWVESMGGSSSSQMSHSGGDGWENFSQARIDELQKQGIPVFVDFTAKWCLICQTNHIALSTSSVSKEFGKKGVVKMKADWTKRNPEITEALRKFGRNGVPLYVYYSGNPDAAPEILPQVLTPDIVLDFIKKETVVVNH